MKKLLCLLLTCSVLTTFANSAALPLNTAAVESSSIEDVWWDAEHSETLANMYTLLNQFIAEQKESGNSAFNSARLYTSSEFYGGDECPEDFKNKVFVFCSGPDEDIVVPSVKAFMQKNDLDENFVDFFWTDIARDPLANACEQLKQFVKEQKENGNEAFYSADVYDSFDYFHGNENGGIPEEYENKVVFEYSGAYEETVLDSVKTFMQENDIDESFVIYFPLEETPTVNSGDINEDGNVDILDVILINKAIMGKASMTENQLRAIDFNGNSKPDAEESLLLLKYIVGIVTDFTM